MKIEIITIGDEILIGQILDTNSAWMAKKLNNSGFLVNQIVSIADDKQQIIKALSEAQGRADVVLMSGGLGPTSDDITKETLCEYFRTELIPNKEVLLDIERLFKAFGSEMIETNIQQANVPANCKVIRNTKGTAPGMWFDNDNKIVISVPGVPYEMKEMMSQHIIPNLCKRANVSAIVHKTILTQGMGESFLARKIQDWESSLSKDNIKLAYLPSAGIVRLRLSASGNHEPKILKQINRKIKELNKLIPSYIFGYDNDTLEQIVGGLLKKNRVILATAESCTGGYIAHLITSVPGSSAYFSGSVIAYSDLIKQNILGVDKRLMQEKGAVSKEVVKEMALGILEKFNTDYAISCSGIAGPDGGSKEKPVGTVWIGVASKSDVLVKKFHFGDNRQYIIRATALTALNLLRKMLVA
ncbi:MAG TPA: competence/damage-inducible protein A [Flavobacteriales bacterium]|nr:competence/damage-inducible protein A [Flavobacteriales bacterium]